jgi:hypothetical protein
MAAPGWRFSVTIPSWTQTELEGDELVVVRSPISSWVLVTDFPFMSTPLEWCSCLHEAVSHCLAPPDECSPSLPLPLVQSRKLAIASLRNPQHTLTADVLRPVLPGGGQGAAPG